MYMSMLNLSPQTSGQLEARTSSKVFDNVRGFIEMYCREERLQKQHCHQQCRSRGWIQASEFHVELGRVVIALGWRRPVQRSRKGGMYPQWYYWPRQVNRT